MSYERNAPSPYANISRVKNRYNRIDTHELLKQELYKQGLNKKTDIHFNNISNVGDIQSVTDQSVANAGFEDIELYFDSTQRDQTSNLNIGELKWNIPNLNNSLNINNCIAIKVREFYFPKIYPATGAPEFFYFLRVFMEIQTAPSTQAILGSNSNKFHFEFEVQDLTGQAVKLVPINDTFYFRHPISYLSDFQIRFLVPPNTSQAVPFRRIPIPADTVQMTSLETGGFGYNPIRFSIANTNVLGPVGAIVAPGLAVFINGYNSNSNAVNDAVNNVNGVFVTNIIDSTTFEIGAINASTVTTPVIPYSASMFIPKNRIALPVRFTSVNNTVTNHIDITHN